MRILILIFIIFCSCSTKKDIIFLQDTSSSINYNFEYKDIKIQTDDILRIKISSKSSDLEAMYNSGSVPIKQAGNSMINYQIEGYLVNSSGFVNIPGLNPIYLKGLTLEEASEKLNNSLKLEEVLMDGFVDIKILNNYFTVIGEVNEPGRYTFLENNMNIFEALGMAGDLTINGKRDDIRIISKSDGKIKVDLIDLTSSKLLTSDNFQIFPDDIIVVNANSAKVKNAGIVGNIGNLLSALSFILSSIILIVNQ